MMWIFLTCLIFNSLFLIQVKSHNISAVVRRDLKNISLAEKQDVTEQNAKLTQKDNRGTLHPSENNSSTLLISSSTEIPGLYKNKPFISFTRNFSTGALLRGFCVFVALGAIVVIYIVVRTIRLRRKKKIVRKYGILANREDVEMTPLGAEEEEEESTLFDMTAHNSHS